MNQSLLKQEALKVLVIIQFLDQSIVLEKKEKFPN